MTVTVDVDFSLELEKKAKSEVQQMIFVIRSLLSIR